MEPQRTEETRSGNEVAQDAVKYLRSYLGHWLDDLDDAKADIRQAQTAKDLYLSKKKEYETAVAATDFLHAVIQQQPNVVLLYTSKRLQRSLLRWQDLIKRLKRKKT